MVKRLSGKLAQEYGVTVHRMERIPTPKHTSVFKLRTDLGTYILKSLHTSRDRQLFILEAEDYLREQGIRIPEVVPTLDGKPYVWWRRNVYVLQRFCPGGPINLRSSGKIKRAGSLLGQFHRVSVGFDSELSGRYVGSSSWIREYDDDLASIQAWKKRESRNPSAKIQAIMPYVRFFQQAGSTARDLLRRNAFFTEWCSLPVREHFLCHGDLHQRNILCDAAEATIIDWEDVRYDFPSKDLTRLLDSVIAHDPNWKAKKLHLLLSAYLQENPLTSQQKSLLFVDMAFPHIFERFLRKKIYVRMSLNQVKQFLRREKQKTKELLRRAREGQTAIQQEEASASSGITAAPCHREAIRGKMG